MSCQTNKDCRRRRSRGLGGSPAWLSLGEGPRLRCFLPVRPLSPSRRRGRASPPRARTVGAQDAQHASSRRTTSSLPSPAQPGPADSTHPRTPVPQSPGCAWSPLTPSPAGARSSDGPGRGQRRGGEPQPAAFGAAGGRTHSSPSPRVNSSRARSAPRLHPPAGAPRRPAPARPARRRRRPLPDR